MSSLRPLVPGLDAEALRAVAAHAARVGMLFAGLGLALQIAPGDRWPLTMPFTFGIPPLVSAALLAVAATGWLVARRRRAALGALVLAMIVGAYAAGRDLVFAGCGGSAGPPGVRVVTWNVRHQLDVETGDRLRSLAADHVVLVEADRVELRAWARTLPGYHLCAPGGGVIVLSRREISSCEWRRLDGRSRAVVASFEGDGPARVIGVDVDGHPLHSRRRAIEAIAALVRQSPEMTIVAGDFNTPRRAWSFEPLRRTHRNAFAEAGRGWAGSWPSPLALLDIDHVWVPDSIFAAQPSCARFLGSAGSDHRPLVVDLALPPDRASWWR